MPHYRRRIRHAGRFAIATLVAVYALGLAWEALETVFAGGAANASALAFNERVWRIIALTEAVVVFLLRVADVESDPPGWIFAAALGLWLGAATVLASIAIEEGRDGLAGLAVIIAVAGWLLARRRLPGRPGTHVYPLDAVPASSAAERELR